MDYKINVTKEHLIRLWKKFLKSRKIKKIFMGDKSQKIHGHVYSLKHKDFIRISMDIHISPREVYTITLHRDRKKDTFPLTKSECDKLIELWNNRPGELEMTLKEVEDLL